MSQSRWHHGVTSTRVCHTGREGGGTGGRGVGVLVGAARGGAVDRVRIPPSPRIRPRAACSRRRAPTVVRREHHPRHRRRSCSRRAKSWPTPREWPPTHPNARRPSTVRREAARGRVQPSPPRDGDLSDHHRRQPGLRTAQHPPQGVGDGPDDRHPTIVLPFPPLPHVNVHQLSRHSRWQHDTRVPSRMPVSVL